MTDNPAGHIVLVVEDNDKNRKLARDVLQVKGYRVMEAESAEAALDLVKEQIPDLVLMDIQLPGMSGIQALACLREMPATKNVPVIAFTASVMPQDRHQIIAAGFDAFVAKPISVKDFVVTVAETITKGRP
jgi:two-component system cell cycle response regulator DivK